MYDDPMKHCQKVTFNEIPSIVEITPHSEVYEFHPRLLISTANGWKISPSRGDPFTGKSSLIMTQRRVQARKKIGTNSARKITQSLLEKANREFAELSSTVDKFKDGMRSSIPLPMNVDESYMPAIRSGSHVPATSPFNKHKDVVMAEVDNGGTVPMIFATRTKPVKNNKFAKRVGAKTAKNLELAANPKFTLSPQDVTTYRALAARCNDLSQDRPDIPMHRKNCVGN